MTNLHWLVAEKTELTAIPENIKSGVTIFGVWPGTYSGGGDMMNTIIAWTNNTLYQQSINIYPADWTITIFEKKLLVWWQLRIWRTWGTSWPIGTIYKNWNIILWPYDQQNWSIDESIVSWDIIKITMSTGIWVNVNAYMKFDFDFDFSVFTENL